MKRLIFIFRITLRYHFTVPTLVKCPLYTLTLKPHLKTSIKPFKYQQPIFPSINLIVYAPAHTIRIDLFAKMDVRAFK